MNLAVKNDYVDLTCFGADNLPGLRGGWTVCKCYISATGPAAGRVLRSRSRT